MLISPPHLALLPALRENIIKSSAGHAAGKDRHFNARQKGVFVYAYNQIRTEQNRTEQNRTEQNRTEQEHI